MKQFYLEIEAIACNPENYTAPNYRPNAIQWKQVAWSTLGTPERMRQLKARIVQAHALARKDEEKERVHLWTEAIWQWMEEGFHAAHPDIALTPDGENDSH